MPIAAHTRRTAQHDGAESGEELPFFDESKVPVQTITLVHTDVEGLSFDQYEVIGEKVTYRIAQRPGAHHVLKYRRPVIKLKGSGKILALPAPDGVIEGSRADVSFGGLPVPSGSCEGGHGPRSNAARAAATARLTSDSWASATRKNTSSVTQFTTSMDALEGASH
jgi:hypothetical protein